MFRGLVSTLGATSFAVVISFDLGSAPASAQGSPVPASPASPVEAAAGTLAECYKHYLSRNYLAFFRCDRELRGMADAEGFDADARKGVRVLAGQMRSDMLFETGQPQEAAREIAAAAALIPLSAHRTPTRGSGFFARAGGDDESERFTQALATVGARAAGIGLDANPRGVATRVLGAQARAAALAGDGRRAALLNQDLALLGDAGARERRYLAFVQRRYDTVVSMFRDREEILRDQRFASVVMLLTSIGSLAYSLSAIPNNALYASQAASQAVTQGVVQVGQSLWAVGTDSKALSDLTAFWANFEIAVDQYVIAKSLIEAGDHRAAGTMLDRLLGWQDLEGIGALNWACLYERGRVALLDGESERGIDLLRRAVEALERVRSTIPFEAGKIGFIGEKQAVYGRLIEALVEQRRWDEAFDYAERAKSRALVDLLAERKVTASLSASARESGVRTLQLFEPDILMRDASGLAWMFDAAKTRSAAGALSSTDAGASHLASLVSVQAVTRAEVLARMAADETLVSYYGGGAELYALVLGSSSVTAARIDRSGLDDEIVAFRRELQARSPKARPLAERLYRRLIAPIQSVVEDRALVIAPHGMLHYLPFGALHDGQRYLVERTHLRVVPSASALTVIPADRSRAKGTLLALGNPDLGDPAQDLPKAEKEATEIARHFQGATVLTGKEASKEAVRQLAPRFSILHFAVHGRFRPEAPLESALSLAGRSRSESELTVSDIYGLRLDADLVTLSACETGLGQIAGGDDIIGLTRGFMYAGARSIVASLWEVDDASTAYLMARFYRNLATTGKAAALRLAQLETLERYPHPFHWAAFQLIGQDRSE